MPSQVRRAVWGVALVAVLALIVLLAIAFIGGPVKRFPGQMPNPNGYDMLVELGGSVRLKSPSDKDLASRESLAELVRANAPALASARDAFSHECRVRLDPQQSPDTSQKAVRIRSLAFAFELEGRLALLEGRTNDFVDSTLALARLARLSCRGGLLLHAMVANAIEEMALNALDRNLRGFDAATSSKAARTLEELDSIREPFAAVMERERLWARESGGLKGQISLLVMRSTIQKTKAAAETKANQSTTHCRVTMLRLAHRAYEFEQGRPLTSVEELVPKYLKSVPMDPATKSPIRYSP